MAPATTGSDDVCPSNGYLIGHDHLGSEPVITVASADGAARVAVARRGATLLRWHVDRLGVPFDLTDGYRDEPELLAQDGMRDGVLAPFPNRVADARYSFADHEYDLLPGSLDDWTLQIPAHTLVRTDDALIPLDGADAYQPLDDNPAMDFRRPRGLRGHVIDACFTDLASSHDRRAETVLRNTRTGDELRVWQLAGPMHVYTGDILVRGRRRSRHQPERLATTPINTAQANQWTISHAKPLVTPESCFRVRHAYSRRCLESEPGPGVPLAVLLRP
jgi:Aldose 1-epimerase